MEENPLYLKKKFHRLLQEKYLTYPECCSICKESFSKYNAELDKEDPFNPSKITWKCLKCFKNKSFILTCKCCQKQVAVQNYRKKTASFCSVACSNRYNKKKVREMPKKKMSEEKIYAWVNLLRPKPLPEAIKCIAKIGDRNRDIKITVLHRKHPFYLASIETLIDEPLGQDTFPIWSGYVIGKVSIISEDKLKKLKAEM